MRAASPVAKRDEIPVRVAAAPRGFHGWHVVAVMFVAQAITVGSTSYAYSLFLRPIAADFGVGAAQLGHGAAGMLIAMMFMGPALGAALDRRSIRALVIAGALLFAAGLAGMAASPSLLGIGLVYCVVVAAGALLAGPLAANKLVTNWFVRMRGRALGISSIGTSVGGAVLPPLAAYLIEALGWRAALVALGASALLGIVPAAWWFIANRPEDRGETPDGDPAAAATAAPVEVHRVPLSSLIRDRNYWGIALTFGLAWGVVTSLFSFFGVYAEDELGFHAQQAAWCLSTLSVSAMIGKLAFGTAAERIDARWLVWLGIAFQLGFVLIARTQPGYPLLLAASGVVGLSLGGLLPMHGLLVAQYYGRGSFAAVMGAMGPVTTPLLIGGISLGAWLPGATGGYARLFDVFVAAQLLAIATFALLRRDRR